MNCYLNGDLLNIRRVVVIVDWCTHLTFLAFLLHKEIITLLLIMSVETFAQYLECVHSACHFDAVNVTPVSRVSVTGLIG